MTPSKSCPQCGAQLPADAPEALCPACLMSKALASGDDATMKLSGAESVAKGAALPSMFPFEFGGYQVLSLLGRGGMGAVYEAQQRATGRRVALKVLGHGMDSEEMRKRFLREGRLAAAVSHPNSIYIFGTEEIEGSPVIVMEIAGGGTLKDELKHRGPLPVRDAVDAMLQIIAGLEAAHAGGVLHRDVKPANCFVSPDGTVKVGDFGLSVSTLARSDTQLTASGMMLGTPSFAPPEQLRGDELDLRADIYSVGATLYTLLTGRAPFEGHNAVQVVAAVLDKAPKLVTEFRKDVPPGLAGIIARCMAKKREARYANYAALRDSLLPFSSQVPQSAPLGLRFVAGMVDTLIAELPNIALGAFIAVEFSDRLMSERTPASLLPWLALSLFSVAYFAFFEGWRGAGPGKAMFGLRVVGPDGNPPGFGRALVRALVVFVANEVHNVLAFILATAAQYQQMAAHDDVPSNWWFWMSPVAWLGLFITARSSNGFAALQDLISGTRVVVRQKSNARPKLVAQEKTEASSPVPESTGERVGPFAIIRPLSAGWAEGNDEALRRHVWIHQQSGGAVPVANARREVARATRLRWIGGVRGDEENWDAFEAPNGQPLLSLKEQSLPWEMVRHWLADLADEINAGGKDNTLPASVSPENVWITGDGRAVLLDEPQSQSAAPCEARFMLTEAAGSQNFLSAVASRVLDPKTVPLHARDVLQKLAAAAFDRVSFIAGNLQSLLTKAATVSRLRRAASLLLLPLGIALLTAIVGVTSEYNASQEDAGWKAKHSDLPPLSAVLRMREASEPYSWLSWKRDEDLHYVCIPVHIAVHYRDILGTAVEKKQADDPATPLDDETRDFIRGCFTGFPPGHSMISADAVARADGRVNKELPDFLAKERLRTRLYGVNALRNVCAAVAIVQFLSLLIFGTTPGQRVFGFAVLNKKGEVAGRLRMLGRWFVAWIPFILVDARFEIHGFVHQVWSTADIIRCFAFGGLWVLGIIAAIMNPQQGTHDGHVKTWLVPR